MATMTKTVSSECSSLSDIDYDPITSTFAKLRTVISQEASLRKELDELFGKRTEGAHIAVQNAQNHLETVKRQEEQMREILKTESTAANGMHYSASSPEDTAGREHAVGLERLQEAAMMSIIEQRYQKQEESDRLTKLEEDRLAELAKDIREEGHRLAAQEAAKITAVEARHQAEAERKRLEEEHSEREEQDRIAAMQKATMVAAIEATMRAVAVTPEKKKKGKKNKGALAQQAPGAGMVYPPIEVYLREEEATLTRTQSALNRYIENVKTLHQLIEQFEKPGIVTTGPLENDSGSLGERTEADVVQPIKNNGPTEEDIAILKKRLADEEGEVRLYLKFAQQEESRVASYRRLIAASSS